MTSMDKNQYTVFKEAAVYGALKITDLEEDRDRGREGKSAMSHPQRS